MTQLLSLSFVPALVERYTKETPTKVKLVDAFLAYMVATAAVVALYFAVVTTFPFNSFVSAFTSCVGCFVLTVCLRIQIYSGVFAISHERAFADFLLCCLVLHLFVMNFMG
eukprot:TRINITY_DN17224_c0_g1_i1.p2 TRINITY_DN17224_c0_g1~~TRINITY_DN17224_c0_g1_i1.p2  ORF type:complete len:111 (+),score=35.74 TRINITY_DN17224_c0_g1_i1:75-407(+)